MAATPKMKIEGWLTSEPAVTVFDSDNYLADGFKLVVEGRLEGETQILRLIWREN